MKRIWFLIAAICSFTQLIGQVTWDAPVTISTSMTDASDPQIVMHPNGDVTAVWIENGAVITNSMAYMGSWSTNSTLAMANSSSPRIAVDGSGKVTAVWLDSGVVYTAQSTTLGMWDTPSALSSSGATEPAIGMNSNGDTVAVWVRSGFIEAKSRASAGSWDLVASVISVGNSDHPDVAIGGNGKVVAIFHRVSNGSDIVQSASQTIGGAWNAPVSLVTVSVEYAFNYPHIALDAEGNAAAIVFRYQETAAGEFINVAAYTTTLPNAGTTWTAIPTKVSSQNGIGDPADLFSKVAFDGAGNTIAVWSISHDSSLFTIESALRVRGSDWSSTNQIFEPVLFAFDGDIASLSIGVILSAYMYFDGVDLSVRSQEANISGVFLDPEWSGETVISMNSNNAFPKISGSFFSSAIHAASTWLYWDGNNVTLQAATGSRSTISPPSNLSVMQSSTNFGSFIDYYNTITWNASPSPNIVQYQVYRNGVLFDTTGPFTFQVEEHGAVQNGAVTYGVSAIDNQSSQSEIVYINFP